MDDGVHRRRQGPSTGGDVEGEGAGGGTEGEGVDPRAAVVVEAHAASRSAGLRQTANDGSSRREYGALTTATGVHGGGVEAVVSMAAAWVRHRLGCRGGRGKRDGRAAV
jgi:hypothetical protein